MSRFSNILRGTAGLGAMIAIAACADADSKLLVPTNPAGGTLLSSYVALGNSITAGWQSGGLNDSVQRRSYAFLFATQAGTRFAYPSFNMRYPAPASSVTGGCPALMGNWRSQNPTDSLIPAGSRQPCLLRDASKATDILNNVAVPFAYASDLLVTGSGVKIPVAPHTFILGGMAQVDRALVADPTFVSVWVGNNETLSPATVGMLGGNPAVGAPALVSGADFKTAFDAAVDSLVRARPGLQGILIGAVKVANTPRFWSADSVSTLRSTGAAARRTAIGTFTGRGAPAVLGCGATGVTGWLVSTELIRAIRTGAFPSNAIVCDPNAATGGGGDIFVLSPTEQATLNAATDDYNVAIQAKATALGWAYLDPNPLLEAQKTAGAIPAFPNFTSNTRDAATSVFGALFSLDGVHPSAAGQRLIANAMIAAVNAKYSLSIPEVP